MLVFRLAWLDDRRVVRLRAPDGGLDTVLADGGEAGAGVKRGWQAKRHTGRIDVGDCQKSLDRAVEFWNPKAVTFAFPHDLTASEHTAFVHNVAARHPGTEVDYWSKSTLLAMLASTEGRRVANDMWEEHDPTVVATQMLRAGSPLQSGIQFAEAEKAISERLGDAVADYDWIIIHGAPESAGIPPLTPGALLRITFTHEQHAMYADCVPRHASPDPVPGVLLEVDDSPAGRQAREWLEALRSAGGRLTLSEGVAIRVSDVPPPFDDLVPDAAFANGEITIRAVTEPAPFYARITAGPPHDRASIDIDLLPVDPGEDWDATLQGRVGSLVVTFRFRWDIHLDRGRTKFSFAYKNVGAPHDVEARVLRWLIASHANGTVDIQDRLGERPTVSQATTASTVAPCVPTYARLHENVAILERAAGAPAPPVPPGITAEDVESIAEMVAILRAGGRREMIRDVRLQLTSDTATFGPRRIIRDFKRKGTLVAPLFGKELPVARETVALPP